ncbi:MAG: hypothetical protein ABI612_02175 [Betaproteobacteria bacterium]
MFQLSAEQRVELLGLTEDSLGDDQVPVSPEVLAEIERRPLC